MIDKNLSDLEAKDSLFDDIENKYWEQLLNSKIIKFFSKDTSTKIALITFVITIGSLLIKILGYIYLRGYLSVFSVPIDGVGYSSNQGFLGFLINIIFFIGWTIAISLVYLAIEVLVRQHNLSKAAKIIGKTTISQRIKFLFSDIIKFLTILLKVLVLTGIVNILLLTLQTSGKLISYSKIEWAVALLCFLILEITTASYIYGSSRKRKKIKVQTKLTNKEADLEKVKKEIASSQRNPLVDIATTQVIIMIFLYVAGIYVAGLWEARQKKAFPIIEGRYAVIHQDQQRYWVIGAQGVDTESLVLNTTTQKILETNGVELNIKAIKKLK